ncbi:hypothetical protein K438DRAFT_260740 [Mycena galopus ATCC 62051]|nr:hypothetical protein K438DRAFT_260740 [Mycena galopus ATCC 62051]
MSSVVAFTSAFALSAERFHASFRAFPSLLFLFDLNLRTAPLLTPPYDKQVRHRRRQHHQGQGHAHCHAITGFASVYSSFPSLHYSLFPFYSICPSALFDYHFILTLTHSLSLLLALRARPFFCCPRSALGFSFPPLYPVHLCPRYALADRHARGRSGRRGAAPCCAIRVNHEFARRSRSTPDAFLFFPISTFAQPNLHFPAYLLPELNPRSIASRHRCAPLHHRLPFLSRTHRHLRPRSIRARAHGAACCITMLGGGCRGR